MNKYVDTSFFPFLNSLYTGSQTIGGGPISHHEIDDN